MIINEDTQHPFLIDSLLDMPTADLNGSKKLFDYAKIENMNKNINLYECSEVSWIFLFLNFEILIQFFISKCIYDLFVSERNLVLITFDLEIAKTNEEVVKSSILRRILKVLTTNIIPSGISIIGFSKLEDPSFSLENFKRTITDEIKIIQNQVQKYIDSIQPRFLDNL